MPAEYDWLKVEHPVYEENKDLWERNERRFYGGDPILAELRPFDWETTQENAGPGNEGYGHYRARQLQAVYINFPDLFVRTLVGHLMRQRPQPEQGLDFGTLGRVQREEDTTIPTQAEMVFFNADGVGNDGSQWDNFWAATMRLAIVTGHRWLMAESPPVAPETEQDELEGKRPYLIEYSPLAVTNWHYEEGKLQWAVIKVAERNPVVTKEGMEGNDYEDGYLLLVREGWDSLGEDFSGGGWWRFNSDLEMEKEVQENGETEIVAGDWESTGGEIPLWILYYERAKATNDLDTISRSGIAEIGQAAVSYMNLSSAADYDAWDAGQSTQFALGVDLEGFNLATGVMKKGSKLVPFPINKKTGNPPQIYDGSVGAVVSGVFETRLNRKREEAAELAALEASATPESSGESKKTGFADIRAPRLALMASELEQAQNTALHFIEQRFGNEKPTGSVDWPEEFELAPLTDSLRELFELSTLSEVRSATLDAKAMGAAARSKGLMTDDDEAELIEAELAESARRRDEAAAQVQQTTDEDLETERVIQSALAAEGAGAPATETGTLGGAGEQGLGIVP